MNRKIYHVFRRDDAWHVRRAGARRSVGYYRTQKYAMFVAILTATTNRRSQIVLHGRDGRIRKEWTYGDDPRRTRG